MGERSVTGRLTAAVVAIAAAALGMVVAAPASAADRPAPPDPQPEEIGVDGEFTATGNLLTDCGLFHQIVDGEGSWSGLGESTFELDFCIAEAPLGEENPVYDGTFTVTSADGTLTGTMGGWVRACCQTPPGSGQFPFEMVLTITGGTGAYDSATGELLLDGAFGPGAIAASGTVSGTVTVPPGQPPSRESCMHGGWRDYVDDEGQAFANQGLCIAFVQRPG